MSESNTCLQHKPDSAKGILSITNVFIIADMLLVCGI